MMNGFIITTVLNREDKAFKEFVGKVYGFDQKKTPVINNLVNFTSLLNIELEKLKKQQNFILKEKHRSILIIKNLSETKPSDIFRWMRKNGLLFQYISRVIPLDFISNFNILEISKYILNNPFEGSYKILFESRISPDNLKEKIFETIIPLIPSKVNLKTPDFLVVVQGFKLLVGICIVENDIKNFNFSILNN